MAFSLLSITKERSDIHLHYCAPGDTEHSFKGHVKGTRPEGEQPLAEVDAEHLVSAIASYTQVPFPPPALLPVTTGHLPESAPLPDCPLEPGTARSPGCSCSTGLGTKKLGSFRLWPRDLGQPV